MVTLTAKGLKDQNGNKISFDYESLENKPRINGMEVTGDLQLLADADAELNATSTNPVQNKAVTEAINALNAAQNLLDIVGTYADLQAYSQEFLQVNDKIKVLNDEENNNVATYYRWTGNAWDFIAPEPVPKIEMDAVVTEGSDKFVSSGVVYTAVESAKQYADNAVSTLRNEIIADLEGDY